MNDDLGDLSFHPLPEEPRPPAGAGVNPMAGVGESLDALAGQVAALRADVLWATQDLRAPGQQPSFAPLPSSPAQQATFHELPATEVPAPAVPLVPPAGPGPSAQAPAWQPPRTPQVTFRQLPVSPGPPAAHGVDFRTPGGPQGASPAWPQTAGPGVPLRELPETGRPDTAAPAWPQTGGPGVRNDQQRTPAGGPVAPEFRGLPDLGGEDQARAPHPWLGSFLGGLTGGNFGGGAPGATGEPGEGNRLMDAIRDLTEAVEKLTDRLERQQGEQQAGPQKDGSFVPAGPRPLAQQAGASPTPQSRAVPGAFAQPGASPWARAVDAMRRTR